MTRYPWLEVALWVGLVLLWPLSRTVTWPVTLGYLLLLLAGWAVAYRRAKREARQK